MVATRPRRGAVERLYRPVARRLEVDREQLRAGVTDRRGTARTAFEVTQAQDKVPDLVRKLRAHLAQAQASEAEGPEAVRLAGGLLPVSGAGAPRPGREAGDAA